MSCPSPRGFPSPQGSQLHEPSLAATPYIGRANAKHARMPHWHARCVHNRRGRQPLSFSILTQFRYARERGYRYAYLGYWIPENRSMSYKSQYRPHEILTRYPADGESPEWREPAPSEIPAGSLHPSVRDLEPPPRHGTRERNAS